MMVKVALPETTWLEVDDIFVDEDKIKNFEWKLSEFQKIDW